MQCQEEAWWHIQLPPNTFIYTIVLQFIIHTHRLRRNINKWYRKSFTEKHRHFHEIMTNILCVSFYQAHYNVFLYVDNYSIIGILLYCSEKQPGNILSRHY